MIAYNSMIVIRYNDRNSSLILKRTPRLVNKKNGKGLVNGVNSTKP